MKICFLVPGRAVPQGSKRPMRTKNNKLIVVDSSGARGKSWRTDIQDRALEAMRQSGVTELFDGPLFLHVEVYFSRPKKHFNSKGILRSDAPVWHTSAPDSTKLMRGIEDALNKVAWTDDSRVCDQVIRKRYADRDYIEVSIICKKNDTDKQTT